MDYIVVRGTVSFGNGVNLALVNYWAIIGLLCGK